MPQRKATGGETPELPPTSHPWRARRSTGHQYPPLFLISSYEESNCISCPRSPVRLGEIARPRRCWQSWNVSGAETWKDSEVGDKDFTPNQQKKPAGSGEKDPICACIMWPSIYCSVYTNITRLFLSNEWVGFLKKKTWWPHADHMLTTWWPWWAWWSMDRNFESCHLLSPRPLAASEERSCLFS